MELGPRNESEREIYAIENLKADMQQVIVYAMRKRDVSRSELARRLGVSRAYITQLLREDANPTLKTIGRIFAALEFDFSLFPLPPRGHRKGVVDGPNHTP